MSSPPASLLLALCLIATYFSATSASLAYPSLCDQGCACLDGEPFVVDCSETGLTEVTLTTTDDYPFPWVVFFGDNSITHVPVIPSQDDLLKISFRMNSISSFADGAFANLTRLQSLDLSYCNLTQDSFTVDAFKGASNAVNKHRPLEPLVELDLSHNHIERLDGHTFNHLMLLRTLYITDNPLHDLTRQTIAAFSELQDLVKLDLSRTQLVRLPHQFLAGMRKLEELVLADNLMQTIPEEVAHAKSLKILILDNNPILTISPTEDSSFFLGPKTLTDLSLSHMPKLQSVGKEAFSGLVNLTRISMTHNPNLQSIHKLAFLTKVVEGNNKLKQVFLQENALSTLDEELLDWNNLDVLNLQHNPWSCDCHLVWFTKGTLQRMITVEPKLTRYIVCAEPYDKTGVDIRSLVVNNYHFPCPRPKDASINAQLYGPLVVITIFIGVMLLISATMLCTYVLYQRSKESSAHAQRVHYTRATYQDMEAIAQRIEA